MRKLLGYAFFFCCHKDGREEKYKQATTASAYQLRKILLEKGCQLDRIVLALANDETTISSSAIISEILECNMANVRQSPKLSGDNPYGYLATLVHYLKGRPYFQSFLHIIHHEFLSCFVEYIFKDALSFGEIVLICIYDVGRDNIVEMEAFFKDKSTCGIFFDFSQERII